MTTFNNQIIKSFLTENNLFLKSIDKLSFIITLSDNKNEMIEIVKIYESFLEKTKSVIFDNKILTFFNKTEKIYFEEIVDSMSEDLGFKIKIFEGFNVDLDKDFLEIISIIEETNISNVYYNVSDVILKQKDNKLILNTLKHHLLDNVLLDSQFIDIIKGMFKNNLNVSKTSQNIYMHRNTLNNKLDYLEFNTSLSLRDFKHALCFYALLYDEINI